MATSDENDKIKDHQVEINANYMPSFAQLAALANSQESTNSTSCPASLSQDLLNKDVFRTPQNRSDRFPSCDEGDDDNNLSRELLELVTDDDRYDLPEIEGTVTTDMKPSLFNFQGFLSTISGDIHQRYAMDKPRRGLAMIFNHDEFDSKLGLTRRSGSGCDARQLKKQLGKLGFELYVYSNLNASDLKRAIKLAASVDHSDADSFMCVFLTHGDDDGFIYASDGEVSLQELLKEFRGDRCLSLLGKPKVFIVQACRGSVLEVGVCETDGGFEDTDAKSEINPVASGTVADAGTCTTVPAGADIIVCYSVVEGYFSFRDTVNGSWFIQALCQALDTEGSSMEFTLLLTLVNRMVAEKSVKRSTDSRMLGKKQMPCFVSMLTKQLVFTPKRYVGKLAIKK